MAATRGDPCRKGAAQLQPAREIEAWSLLSHVLVALILHPESNSIRDTASATSRQPAPGADRSRGAADDRNRLNRLSGALSFEGWAAYSYAHSSVAARSSWDTWCHRFIDGHRQFLPTERKTVWGLGRGSRLYSAVWRLHANLDKRGMRRLRAFTRPFWMVLQRQRLYSVAKAYIFRRYRSSRDDGSSTDPAGYGLTGPLGST